MEVFPKDILDLLIVILPLGILNRFRITNKRIYNLCNEAFTRITDKLYPGHLQFLSKEGLISQERSPEYNYIAIKHYYKYPNDTERIVKANNYIGLAIHIFKNKPHLIQLGYLSAKHSAICLFYVLYKQGDYNLLEEGYYGGRLLLNAIRYNNYESVKLLVESGITVPNPLYFASPLAERKFVKLLGKMSTLDEIKHYQARVAKRLGKNIQIADPPIKINIDMRYLGVK